MLKYLLKKCQTMDVNKMQMIRLGLAFTYAIVGWHAAIYMYYLTIKDELPSTPEKRQAFIQKMSERHDNVHHIKVEGLTVKKDTSTYKGEIVHNYENEYDKEILS